MEEYKPTILIVDDNPRNLKLVGILLCDSNYNFYMADDGQSALEVVEKTLPDLILMDVMMPEMDGYEACKRLKANPKFADIPVIFLTAKVDSEDLVKGFAMGGVDYIKKPFGKEELMSRVKNHLDLKFAKDRLKAQNIELDRLNATKDKFFSIIAHDLRNPIGAIRNLSEMLYDEFDTMQHSEAKDFVGHIKYSSDSVYDLLENLLTWSRQQRNLIATNLENCNLNMIVQNTSMLLKPMAMNKNIELTSEIDGDGMIFADANQITTVLRNLVSNAVKFTPANGSIKIKALIEDDHYRVEVIDTGNGISEENINKLFKIESSFSTNGTADEKGTGLGLVLCMDFIKKNKGTIGVTSSLGQGSTFFFTVPRQATD